MGINKTKFRSFKVFFVEPMAKLSLRSKDQTINFKIYCIIFDSINLFKYFKRKIVRHFCPTMSGLKNSRLKGLNHSSRMNIQKIQKQNLKKQANEINRY